MSLSDLASIGSLVSGFAVLVTLLYLNAQVRQAAKHTRAAIGHGFATRTVDFNYRMTDEALAAVIAKGRKGTEVLSEVEAYRFFAYCRATFWNAADTFVQHREGLMDDEMFATFKRAHVGMMQSRGMRIAWELGRAPFTSEFVAFMNRIAEEAAALEPLDLAAVWAQAIAAPR
jgi:hypothetical protein